MHFLQCNERSVVLDSTPIQLQAVCSFLIEDDSIKFIYLFAKLPAYHEHINTLALDWLSPIPGRKVTASRFASPAGPVQAAAAPPSVAAEASPPRARQPLLAVARLSPRRAAPSRL